MKKSYKYASVLGAVSLFGLGGTALLLHDKSSQGTVSDDVYWKQVASVEKRAANVSDDDQIEDLVKLADRLNANSSLIPASATKIADNSLAKAKPEEKKEDTNTMKLVDSLNKKSEEVTAELPTEEEPTTIVELLPEIQPEQQAQTPQEVRQEVVDDQNTENGTTEQEGWNEDHTMYYISGIFVTGEQEIDGKTYYFRDNGEVYDGWRTSEDDNGNEIRFYYIKGERASGRTEIDGDYYHFDKETGVMTTNDWYTPSPNEKYYYGSDGKEVRGVTNIDGHLYSFAEDGKLQTGLHKENYKGHEIDVYSNGDGKKQYGITVTVGDKKYKLDAFTGGVYDGEWEGDKYKDKDGNYVTGKQVIAGRTLMFDGDNNLVRYWYTDKDGNHYFADPNSGELVTGLVSVDGKKYYFDTKTHQSIKDGWTEASNIGLEKTGKVYFVKDGENAPYLATGKTKIGDDYYMFDEDGVLITNAKDDYYTDENGKVSTGEQKVDGKERYYDEETGKRIVGWYTDKNNKTYYYSANDGKVKGDYVIDGVTFKFDDDTGELLSRGLTGEFFINDDGSIYKGLKTIDGKTYYFNPNNQGKMAKGFVAIPGKYNNGKNISAYFDDKGVMQTGVLDIEGQEYYATKEDGLIRDDIVERDGEKYYYRANGVLFKNGKIKSGSKTITSDENGVVTSTSEGLENPLLPANGSVETFSMGNPKQPGNPFAPGWCTTWAYDRFYEVYGYDPGFRGNGEANARELVAAHPDKFKMSSTPVAGAIFSIPTGVITSSADAAVAGHVGFVEKVEGDTIYVSEGAYTARGTGGYVKYSLSSFYGGKAQYAVPVDSGL